MNINKLNKADLTTQIIHETTTLPIEELAEVLNFVQFLKFKKAKTKPYNDLHQELKLLDDNELLHLEAEFKNYKEDYPHE